MKNDKKRNIIPIITKEAYLKLPTDEIEVIEQRGPKMHVKTVSKNCYTVQGHIRDIEALLPPESFYRVMRSIVVNFDHLDGMWNGTLRFESGMRLGVGKNNYVRARRAFRKYLLGQPLFIDDYNRIYADAEGKRSGDMLKVLDKLSEESGKVAESMGLEDYNEKVD